VKLGPMLVVAVGVVALMPVLMRDRPAARPASQGDQGHHMTYAINVLSHDVVFDVALRRRSTVLPDPRCSATDTVFVVVPARSYTP